MKINARTASADPNRYICELWFFSSVRLNVVKRAVFMYVRSWWFVRPIFVRVFFFHNGAMNMVIGGTRIKNDVNKCEERKNFVHFHRVSPRANSTAGLVFLDICVSSKSKQFFFDATRFLFSSPQSIHTNSHQSMSHETKNQFEKIADKENWNLALFSEYLSIWCKMAS